MRVFIQGLPVGQPRTKATIRGAHAAIYTPETAAAWKAMVAKAVEEAIDLPIPGPVKLDAEFLFHRPKYHLNAKGIKPNAPTWHTSKPDTSNLVKAVEDCLGGIAFFNDSQICLGTMSKRYTRADEVPGLFLTIEAL
jgi:Holliday junction resolvase RusA-like endonuclease